MTPDELQRVLDQQHQRNAYGGSKTMYYIALLIICVIVYLLFGNP